MQFIRAVVKYIELKTKSKNNRLQRAIFCCIQCFLSCVECCIDKISKNAYIWIAIQYVCSFCCMCCALLSMSFFSSLRCRGDSFPSATCSAFKLLWRNLGRVAAINMVSAYLLFVGKCVVVLCTTAAAALVLTRYTYYVEVIENPVIPCLVVFALSYCGVCALLS